MNLVKKKKNSTALFFYPNKANKTFVNPLTSALPWEFKVLMEAIIPALFNCPCNGLIINSNKQTKNKLILCNTLLITTSNQNLQ
jgi:hypothetical protein